MVLRSLKWSAAVIMKNPIYLHPHDPVNQEVFSIRYGSTKSIDYLLLQVILLVMFGLGIPEIIVILVIVVLVSGAGKLPGIMGSVANGIRDFKKEIKEPANREK